jgi:NAD(P)H-dependent FMN reductase
MKIIAINGSPRKKWNTAMLLEKALEGAASQGAETLCCYETLQFEDYDKVVFQYFDPEERKERRRTVFPEDCHKAFKLGVQLTTPQ